MQMNIHLKTPDKIKWDFKKELEIIRKDSCNKKTNYLKKSEMVVKFKEEKVKQKKKVFATIPKLDVEKFLNKSTKNKKRNFANGSSSSNYNPFKNKGE